MKSKTARPHLRRRADFITYIFEQSLVVRLRGIEPPHAVPETTALSTELQAHFTVLL